MVKRPCIENRTFDEISVGDEASLSRTLAWRDIELFAAMSGDVNPAHVDAEFAKNDMFHKILTSNRRRIVARQQQSGAADLCGIDRAPKRRLVHRLV